ncbi:ribosome biogenesis GTPase YlqF [Mycoplasma flocculare]|uniref:Ribosome biogenesis GTPase A n=2 Tax=Mesomycoplasma flocculare TaxID=2128 RepID=A0A0A8E6T8_MESFC|nr:ribosome biogenesis GTP-binding protein YlqF [Mesomycoplasma flocculare ATCC 27399]ENX51052.1 GTP-binding protein [Mesomycoplasma flocculare ATCC 27716]MXR13337.1 ribosome biogenesis GTPase YlqF [Mesomycoplasma flocculare]
MKINWFPGHMAKSLNNLSKKARIIDIFIIVVDARAPISSINDEFLKFISNKFLLVVVTKIDLGDSEKFLEIKNFFEQKNFFVLFLNLKNNTSKNIIISQLNYIFKLKQKKQKAKFETPSLKIFVLGMPNTGKSTLINLVTNSRLKVGNQPGITRNNQWISSGKFLFLDTPGILPPKIENQKIALKLALIGLIKQEIIDLNFLFFEAYKLISELYPNLIKDLDIKPAENEAEITKNLSKLAEIKHFKDKNGLDLIRCQIWFLNYIRQQKITLD